MYENNIFQIIINSIKNFFKILVTLVAKSVTSLFGIEQKEIKIDNKQETNKQEKQNKKNKKKKQETTDTNTTLPDEDNIKSNPHDNKPYTEEDLKLQKPQRIYKVYTKDNELKYLTIEKLLDLLLKEELEAMYKQEKFKLKKATTNELIKIDKIKERIYEPIIDRAEKDILRNSYMIREALQESLIEDQLKDPLFPNHPKKDIEAHKETITQPKQIIDDEPVTVLETTETTLEEPKISIKDEIKNVTLVGATLATKVAVDLLTPNEEVQPTQEEITHEEDKKNSKKEQPKQETPPTKEEIKQEQEIVKLQEEVVEDKEKTVEELEDLKEKVEQKIEELKKEKKKEETKESKKEEQVKELKIDSEIIDVSMATTALLEGNEEELSKEDFEERDYDKLERQIDKMLDDITNTLLKYGDTLTPKQKEKLRKEEAKLREAKEDLSKQKYRDIDTERRHLNDEILNVEKEGLQKELKKIHEENEREVSPEFLRRMAMLEGMTQEQVANMDKKILLSRFRKANLALEMTSILALPFVRNKYFFAFTVGMIVDNHFNFVNAFFRRRINAYEPADLESIKRGQDALNGALDITYKNLVELDYLEQQALSRYPELAYDPRYVSQVTSLRTNLTRKYNKLMKKNETMEKYRLKTQKQVKKLNFKKRRQRIFGRNQDEDQNQGRR
jgi:hypothetical protein